MPGSVDIDNYYTHRHVTETEYFSLYSWKKFAQLWNTLSTNQFPTAPSHTKPSNVLSVVIFPLVLINSDDWDPPSMIQGSHLRRFRAAYQFVRTYHSGAIQVWGSASLVSGIVQARDILIAKKGPSQSRPGFRRPRPVTCLTSELLTPTYDSKIYL